MHIAICDDRSDVPAAIDDILKSTVFDEICGKIESTAAFTDAEAFLSHLESTPTDIVIIDIMLDGDVSGIDIAKKINREHPAVSIIFISGSTDYFEKVYEANHCYYLQKPLTAEKLSAAFKKAAQSLRSESIFLPFKGRFLNICTHDIVMVESLNRNIHIYLRSGEVIKHTEKLSDVEMRLSGCNFIRCHQSYVINTNHIAKIYSNEVIMHTEYGDIPVPVSRRYQPHVKVSFMRNLGYAV